MNRVARTRWPAVLGLLCLGVAAWPLERVLMNGLLPPGTVAAGLLVGVGLVAGVRAAGTVAAGALVAIALASSPRLTGAAIVVAGLGLSLLIDRKRSAFRFDIPPARMRDAFALLPITVALCVASGVLAWARAAIAGGDAGRAAGLGAAAGLATLVWMTIVAGAADFARRSLKGRWLEAGLLAMTVVIFAIPLFLGHIPPFLLLGPVSVYALFRFRVIGAGLILAPGLALMIAATSHGDGFYASGDVANATAEVCALSAIVLTMGLLLAAGLSEREDSAERLGRLAGALHDGLMDLDGDGVILHVNVGLTRLVGMPAAELTGQRPPYGFLEAGPEGSAALLELLDRARRTGEAQGDCLLRAAGGDERRVACTVLAMFGPDSRRRPFTAVFKDVTAVDRRARQHQALAALVARAEAEASIDRFQQLAVESAAAALGLHGAVVLTAEPHDRLVVAAATGELRLGEGERFPINAGALVALLAQKRARIVSAPELLASSRTTEGERPVEDILPELGFSAIAVAPIEVSTRFWGVLAAPCDRPGQLVGADLDFLATVARLVGEAVAAAELDVVDPSTGLPNRAGLLPALERLASSGRGSGRSGATVLAIELETRAIVLSLGYERVEQIVASAVERLRAGAGDAVLGRLSPDVLVLAYPRLGPEAAVEVAGSVRAALAAPLLVAGHEIVLSTSVGVADHDAADPAELLHEAVVAARVARRGRSAVELFDPLMQAEAVARLRLEGELRRAIADREIELHYQPIVLAHEQRVVAFEALARWRRPKLDGTTEMVAPDEFIPLAEETDLIRPLTRFVIACACEQMSEWNRLRGDQKLAVSVNLSASDLTSPDLVAYVASVIERTGIAPDQLSLELTETTLLRETAALSSILASLREMGVWLILDDFGTGYASLSMLKRLEPQVVKLDRMFLAFADRVDEAIVAATVELSAHLNARVVAEGVETRAQLERVKALGCYYIQGFLVAPALQPETATELAVRRLVTGWHPPAPPRTRELARRFVRRR